MVLFINMLNSTICLNGFTIINGNAESGGGISSNNGFCCNVNYIVDNEIMSQHLGGGLYFILCECLN